MLQQTAFPFAIHSTVLWRAFSLGVPAIVRRYPMPLKAAATKRARGGRSKARRIPARTFALFSLVTVVIGLASAVLQARYTFIGA
jgi:hypothetical protein